MKVPFCPSSLWNDPKVLLQFFSGLLLYCSHDRKLKQALGWKGINQVKGRANSWVCQLYNDEGFYGITLAEKKLLDKYCWITFDVYYFPEPNASVLEQMPFAALYLSQLVDYSSKIRSFCFDETMKSLFQIGRFTLILNRFDNEVELDLSFCELVAIEAPKSFCRSEYAKFLIDGKYEALYSVLNNINRFCQTLVPSITRLTGFPIHRICQSDNNRRVIWLDGAAGLESVPSWAIVPSVDRVKFKPFLLIVSGFLGSGKTSFINEYIEAQNRLGQFVAVIQNEIGAKGLDKHLMVDDFAVVTLDDGCVCCSISGNVESAISKICKKFHPEYIVLECSGVANPMNLLSEQDTLHHLVNILGVVTIVDAISLSKLLGKSNLAMSQVCVADIVLLNHASEVSEGFLKSVRDEIGLINPNASMISCDYGRVHPNELVFNSRCIKTPITSNHNDDGLKVVNITPYNDISPERFRDLISQVGSGMVRCKGYIGWEHEYIVQATATHFETLERELACKPFLMVAGYDLDADALSCLGVVQTDSKSLTV